MNYLFDVEKDQSMFTDLFTAVTDRVWALTSKVQGTFEFDVQPLREYFAARYLTSTRAAPTSGLRCRRRSAQHGPARVLAQHPALLCRIRQPQ
uniref:hypothetical protein n=1 Tax=Streptomyces yatensis TaxID=155177 RepID=UPI001B3C987F